MVSEAGPHPATDAVLVAVGHVDARRGDTKEAARETKVSVWPAATGGATNGGTSLPSLGSRQQLQRELCDAGAGRGCWRAELGPWVTPSSSG